MIGVNSKKFGGLCLFGRSCMLLDISMLREFLLAFHSFSSLLVYSDYLGLHDSILAGCTVLGIYHFLLGYLICFLLTIHGSLFLCFVPIVMSPLSFQILFI
jgi:hypothetical protein